MSLKTRFGQLSIPGARGRRRRAPESPRQQPRSPRHSRRSSPIAQPVEPVLVDSEVVGQLVQDGDPDLVLELLGVVPELLFEGPPVDRDLRRQVRRLLEEPEEIGLAGVLVFDDHRDVFEAPGEVGRKRVEGSADMLVELRQDQYFGFRGRRIVTSRTVSTPKRNPPIWAKKATPPPDSGCTIAKPPCQSWNRNQKPRKKIAGSSWKKMRMKKIAVRTRAFGRRTK